MQSNSIPGRPQCQCVCVHPAWKQLQTAAVLTAHMMYHIMVAQNTHCTLGSQVRVCVCEMCALNSPPHGKVMREREREIEGRERGGRERERDIETVERSVVWWWWRQILMHSLIIIIIIITIIILIMQSDHLKSAAGPVELFKHIIFIYWYKMMANCLSECYKSIQFQYTTWNQ